MPWDLPEREVELVSRKEFMAGRKVRFGQYNPELADVPFWNMMIRKGWSAYAADEHYGTNLFRSGPTWCFERYGMSQTLVYDKFVVYVGGEHEDSYDPNFQIYNDVIVRSLGGEVWVYTYSRDVFPPTDFHTATYIKNSHSSVDESLILIGGLGYKDERQWWHTPVYQLSLRNLSIMKLDIRGPEPGWIWNHTAILEGGVIHIHSGKRLTDNGKTLKNNREARLDILSQTWI